MEPSSIPSSTADPISDIRIYFDSLDTGLRARAMSEVYEDQQKQVIDLQREQMEALSELAITAVKARAAVELGRQEECDRMVAEVMEPLRARLRQLGDDVAEANRLLDAYASIGRGVV